MREDNVKIFADTEKLCKTNEKLMNAIEMSNKNQKLILEENLLSTDACFQMIVNRRRTLWERKMEQHDFLTVRVGTGTVPLDVNINYREEDFTMEVDELRGEKIDIVHYDERIEDYVANALAPAEVISVTMTGERACRVRVAPDQLSLAIGKEGQNARLAAKLTGYKIDIKPLSKVGE